MYYILGMKKTILLTIGIFVGIIIVLNIFIPEPKFRSDLDRLDFAILSNQHSLAEETALRLIGQDSTNIEYYVSYIKEHFMIPLKTNKTPGREDNTIFDFLSAKEKSKDTIVSDIARYGLGLYSSKLDFHRAALDKYRTVKNKNLKYLNNSLGYTHLELNNLDSSEFYLKKEIANKGNLDGAYSNLSQLYLKMAKFEDLKKLYNDIQAKPYLSTSTERYLAFYFHDYVKYVQTILINPVKNAENYTAFLASLLILFAWLFYLKKVDVFEPESWDNIFKVFLLGAAFSFFVYPISDSINIYAKFSLNENMGNDFLYYISAIGFVEELVKIIPFLIILKYTKIVNEPIDYIVYASVIALGFAFVENIEYFNSEGLQIIHGRALVSVFVHFFNTSLIAYGIFYNETVKKKNVYLNFVIFLLLASFLHGFFDFWIYNKTLNLFGGVLILLVFLQINLYSSFINNTLNHSNFFSPDISLNTEKLKSYLFASLSSVFIFEYIAISLKYSVSAGNSAIFPAIYTGSYMLIFITNGLSNLTLVKGGWGAMEVLGFTEQIDYASNLVGVDIHVLMFTNNDWTVLYLPNHGQIISNHIINKEKNWYLVKLEIEVENSEYKKDRIVLRPKIQNEKLRLHSDHLVGLYLLKENYLEHEQIGMKDLKFVGWVTID